MKKFLLGAITPLLFIGCSPNNNPTPTPNNNGGSSSPTLNTTEQSLVGTWQLRVISDSVIINGTDTGAHTYYNNTAATTVFKNTASEAVTNLDANNKDCQDPYILSTPTQTFMIGTGGTTSPWQYNESTQRLLVMGFAFKIWKLTADSLVVQYDMSAQYPTKRRTYTFTH